MYVNTRHLCGVFAYIHSLLIEKVLCDHQNIFNSFHMFVCAFPAEISSIFGKSFSFPFPYFVLLEIVTIYSPLTRTNATENRETTQDLYQFLYQ